MQLKDGRRLGYAEYGDPKGKPLFFFHGWPSSRKGAEKYDDLAKRLHIRVVSSDRPGFGLSDYKKDRTLLDWPDDVIELADYLKIKKFAVMGVSGGGPYGSVCGYKLLDRITNMGIVVGLGPVINKHSVDGITWMSKLGWANFDKPVVRRISVLVQYFNTYYGFHLGIHRYNFIAKSDRKLYRDPDIQKSVYDNYREAFRQGYRGPEWDLKLYAGDWGYRVGDIKTKTYLWYGAADRNVSLNMGKYYAAHIRGSKLKIYQGEGHLISVTHAKEILKTLTQ